MISDSLKKLNKEVLELQRSREYSLGRTIYQGLATIRSFHFRHVRAFLEARSRDRRIRSYHKQNENFFLNPPAVTEEKVRLAVYTCITGNYDVPLEPYYVDENIDYYIITDMEISVESNWRKIDIHTLPIPAEMDMTRKARYVKTHPHLLFPDYRYSVWVDGLILCVADLREYIPYTGRTGIAAHWHPLRNCIYSEAKVCKIMGRDNGAMINRQMRKYLSEGMPKEFGLIESGFLLREHGKAECIGIMEEWWEQISQYSKRDQISLPYAIWKRGFTMKDIGFIGTNISNNYSFRVMTHPDHK